MCVVLGFEPISLCMPLNRYVKIVIKYLLIIKQRNLSKQVLYTYNYTIKEKKQMYTSEIDVLVLDVCLHLSVEGSKFKNLWEENKFGRTLVCPRDWVGIKCFLFQSLLCRKSLTLI